MIKKYEILKADIVILYTRLSGPQAQSFLLLSLGREKKKKVNYKKANYFNYERWPKEKSFQDQVGCSKIH